MSPPWWVPGEPGGAQGQQLGCRGGLCEEDCAVATAREGRKGKCVPVPRGLTHWVGMSGHHTAPRARHKLQNNLFPVTHSWGPASTPRPP